MDLFISDPKVDLHRDDFKKEAAVPVAVGRDDTKWVQEISNEVLRAHPYLQDAEIQIQIVRADPQSGSATGRVVVSESVRRDMPPTGTPSIFLPFVIRGFELSPLDIATDGQQYFPATQERIERFLFPPSIAAIGPDRANISSQGSFIGDLLPPSRAFQGLSGTNSQMKMASARPSIIDDALLCAHPGAVNMVRGAIREDVSVADALRATIPYSLSKIAQWVPYETDQSEVLPFPSTVLLHKTASGKIRVIMGNCKAFEKIAQDIPEDQAMQSLPPEGQEEVQEDMSSQGYAMMQSAEHPVWIPELPKQDPSAPIKASGTYIVFMRDGSTLTGWATKNTYTFDGTPTEQVIFSNGAVFDMKPEMAGVLVGTGQLPPVSRSVAGAGFFIFRYGGDVHCYGPVQLGPTQVMPDGSIVYSAQEIMTGQQIILQPVDELIAPSAMGGGLYGIPRRFEFLALSQQVDLLPPGQIMKTAEARLNSLPSVEISSHGRGRFSIEGDPVADLPSDDTTDIDKIASVFLLGVMGVPAKKIEGFLKKAEAGEGSPVRISNVRKIVPLQKAKLASPAKEYALKKPPKWILKEAAAIASCMRTGALSRYRSTISDLFKMAAPVPTSETLDSILSLNLINPRTIGNFIRQRPTLEEAMSVLCSLLMFARVGAPGVPELAIERCIENLEDVISSLNMMSYRV